MFKNAKLIYLTTALIFLVLCAGAISWPIFCLSPNLPARQILFNFLPAKQGFMTGTFLPINANRETEITMLFLGDLMLDRQVGAKIKAHGFDYLFTKLKGENFFAPYNIVAANLEGAVTDNGKHYEPKVAYDFAFAPALIQQLKLLGFNFFNLANNHILDQGQKGFLETKANLTALDLNYSGCSDGGTGECSASIVEIKNKKVGLAGFSMVYSEFNLQEAKKIVSELASSTDEVVINIHWGMEYEHDYNKHQENTAHELIDSGADIIIGHHPHVVQGMEIYQGKPIFYSLGNFIFDQYFSTDTEEGLAVGVEIENDKIQRVILSPFRSHESQVELMTKEEKIQFFDKFISWSPSLSTEIKEQIKKGQIRGE